MIALREFVGYIENCPSAIYPILLSTRNTNFKIIPLSHETKIIKFPNILWLYEVVDLISLVECLKEYRSIFKVRRDFGKPRVSSAPRLLWFINYCFLNPQDVAAMVVGKRRVPLHYQSFKNYSKINRL